jgi:dihydroorotase
MEILLRQVRIIDPSSPFHQQTTDIFIQNGIVSEIGTIGRKADHEINAENLCISPGWTDIFSHFNDPGFEYKETLETGAAAAAAGGYTDVMILPNTQPVIHNKAGIEYIVQRGKSLPVSIHPVAAVTKNAEGKELAEMYDMHQSGAVAFTDGTCTIQSAGLLLKALQYVKAVDKVIIQVPDDRSINPSGLMNEGIVSTRLGLPGKPAIAEELMVARDIELAKYTGSKIHFTGISTAQSLALIKKAKEEGVAVTCSVTPYHLFFTDADLNSYDTNLKVNPPLRTQRDRDALRQGLIDGVIDCIASHHLPQDPDHKVVEFEYAQPGMISLETCFAAVRTAIPDLPLEKLVQLMAIAPRAVFDLPAASVNKGGTASLSLFFPDREWTPGAFRSRSKNAAFAGTALKGKPLGIINKDRLFLND